MAASAAPPRIRIVTGADDFGAALKDALLSHLRSLPNIDVLDLGTDSYYAIADRVATHVNSPDVRGLLVCGTGIGVSIFANKHPRVYAAPCSSTGDALNTRSINDCNVLCLGANSTSPEDGALILDSWLNAPFKSPCPASGGSPWPDHISSFLDASLPEMAKLPSSPTPPACAICFLREGMEFEKVGIMPGGEMRIVRESPTSAVVKFARGSVEPAHHHTFGHDVVVTKGRKKVWNLTKGESYEIKEGDYLFTPAGDLHRVKYLEDTEFFIRWDGKWDIFLDEDIEAANAAINKDLDPTSG